MTDLKFGNQTCHCVDNDIECVVGEVGDHLPLLINMLKLLILLLELLMLLLKLLMMLLKLLLKILVLLPVGDRVVGWLAITKALPRVLITALVD